MTTENKGLALIEQVDNFLPTEEVLKKMRAVCDYMVNAKMLPPGYNSGADLMVIGLRARELGVSLGEGVQGMFPMKGRIGYMGGFLTARVRTRLPYADFKIKESTKDKCVLEWRRNPDDAYQTCEFSMEEVTACNYDKNWDKEKSVWKEKQTWKDRKNMLYWRCVSRMVNRHFSDVFGSPVYTADELMDSETIDITPEGKAKIGAPYQTAQPVPEPAVSEISDAEVIPADTAGPIVEPEYPPVLEKDIHPEPIPTTPPTMNQKMVDGLVSSFETGLKTCSTKREVDELFEDLKKTGIPAKILTNCFNLKKTRKEEMGAK